MPDKNLIPKKVSESRITMMHLPQPNECNVVGNIFGGDILKHIDSAGGICASKHVRGRVVTAGIGKMYFLKPVKPGGVLLFHCSVNLVQNTSMEVGIRIENEDRLTGEIRHVGTCYLTFVGVDEEGKPCVISPLEPEDDEDKRRMADATRRVAFAKLEKVFSTLEVPRQKLFFISEPFSLCYMDSLEPSISLSFGREFTLMGTSGRYSGMVHRKKALTFEKKQKIEIAESYYCLYSQKSSSSLLLPTLSAIITLLEASKIAVMIASTEKEDKFFIPFDSLDKATTILKAAGYIIESVSI